MPGAAQLAVAVGLLVQLGQREREWQLLRDFLMALLLLLRWRWLLLLRVLWLRLWLRR